VTKCSRKKLELKGRSLFKGGNFSKPSLDMEMDVDMSLDMDVDTAQARDTA
jgi:hypothetical protein